MNSKLNYGGFNLSSYVLETENLKKDFKKITAVESLNLKLKKGKIYALVGPNGAGKTTAMALMLNILNPTSGKVKIFDKYSKVHPEVYLKVGSIIENAHFYKNLTAYENLKILSLLRNDDEDIEDILNYFSINSKKKFKNFSLGMKQRLAIAASLMHKPDLLILDEPINGLDPFGIIEVRDIFKKLSKKYGVTILISSHILSEVEEIADELIFMKSGKIIEEISKGELYKKLGSFVEFEVSNIKLAIDLLKKEGLKEDLDFKVENNKLKIYSNFNKRSEFNELFVNNGIKVNKLYLANESLEEYFNNIMR